MKRTLLNIMMGCLAALSLAGCGSSGGGSGSGGSSDSGGDPSWASDSLRIADNKIVEITESNNSYKLILLSNGTCQIDDKISEASFKGKWSDYPTEKVKFVITISGLTTSTQPAKCTCEIKVEPQIVLTIPADKWDAYREGTEVSATLDRLPFTHDTGCAASYPSGVGTIVKVKSIIPG